MRSDRKLLRIRIYYMFSAEHTAWHIAKAQMIIAVAASTATAMIIVGITTKANSGVAGMYCLYAAQSPI